MACTWRNFQTFSSRPLFIIILRPKILFFVTYSIFTGQTKVEFVIYWVLKRHSNKSFGRKHKYQINVYFFCLCIRISGSAGEGLNLKAPVTTWIGIADHGNFAPSCSINRWNPLIYSFFVSAIVFFLIFFPWHGGHHKYLFMDLIWQLN